MSSARDKELYVLTTLRETNILEVAQTSDFEVNGLGDHHAWTAAEPMPLICRDNRDAAQEYTTWFKALWSHTGIYFLIDCKDQRLTTTGLPDLSDLWNEDVAEVFLWTDPQAPMYFEYNISPLNSEMVILCPHFGEDYVPWLPWHYREKRRVRHATAVRGGPSTPGAAVSGWSAEFFIPSRLLTPMRHIYPKRGLTWRANVYRIDYDGQPKRYFAWGDVGPSFHNYQAFPTLKFV